MGVQKIHISSNKVSTKLTMKSSSCMFCKVSNVDARTLPPLPMKEKKAGLQLGNQTFVTHNCCWAMLLCTTDRKMGRCSM